MNAHVRWLIRRDLSEVLGIENASYDHPWPEEVFLQVLRQRNCVGMVAEHGERVVGFFIYELYKNEVKLVTIPRLKPLAFSVV